MCVTALAVPIPNNSDLDLDNRLLTRFVRDRNGQIAIITAVLLPVFVGALALGAEVTFWYMSQDKLQNAADVSAHAAAIRLKAGEDDDELAFSAERVASRSGFNPETASLTVNHPPEDGPNAGDPDFVEVIINEERPRLFTAIFDPKPVRFQGRAVASVANGMPVCVLSLSEAASGSITLANMSAIDLSGCSAGSNSSDSKSIMMSANAELSADCIHTRGGGVFNAMLRLNACEKALTVASMISDPYQSIPEPVASSIPCGVVSASVGGTTYLYPMNMVAGVRAGRICGGYAMSGRTFLQPGLYIVDGNQLKVNDNAIITGNDVTLFFTNGASANFSGKAVITISAPKQGTYAGMLIFGSRRDYGVVHKISESTTSKMTGAFYTPASRLEFSGASQFTGSCSQLIADTVLLSGKSKVSLDCGPTGMRSIIMGSEVVLVE